MTSQPPSPPPQPEQPAEAVPTCYRHPAKETWVRCQRCERPICPDCMRDAAVGFQCPECVSEGNRGIRQAKSTFGGNLVRTPYVTWTILGLTALAFAGQLLAGGLVTSVLQMWPIGVAIGDYYRLVTVALVHSDLIHILFNGWAIFVIGPYLERAFGHTRFAALYVLSALGGSVLGMWMDPENTATVGASGAVFGMFGAVFVVGRRLNLDVRGITVIIALNLAITFVFPLISSARISWTGHVGGLVTGTLLAAALAYAPARNRALWHALAIAGTLVVLVALVLVRVPAILSMLR
ncbi:rhomboid family intramembrane serine protease [Nonomuraea jiangxiensis]|uniref:Membrane associated serine protease, rhomboid family n=1 Tax=Nonomuraea jiangxiensis TaxID=633440 RepID=A0A1G9QHI5_9ACTN|nr:rhomboid family intramembrane serine protease [Nonomuraea jiangxiensis]SDM10453.1 Membrane associated serine protease, rhomboid family [Nonomuraea jiangxiensis]